MKFYAEIAELYTEKLHSLYSAGEIKQLFLMVYTHLTKKRAVYFALERQELVEEELIAKFQGILNELCTGRPVQHILGKADFYGMQLKVNASTLIPRPETEELVDIIIKKHAQQGELCVLYVGTGTGCIALALKKHLVNAEVYAMEISPDAIQIARNNAEQHQLDVQFIQADVLEWDAFMSINQQFDIIVSNPPYITPQEGEHMHKNVLQFEPYTALFVEAHAPLLFYDTIADMAKSVLKSNGLLYFEINQYLGAEMIDLLQKKGFSKVELHKDINGVDRMLTATYGKNAFFQTE